VCAGSVKENEGKGGGRLEREEENGEDLVGSNGSSSLRRVRECSS
jgi:hypothetical protein